MMTKIDQDALEAAARALFEKHSSLDSWSWDEEAEGVRDIFRGKAQAAIAAYLAAREAKGWREMPREPTPEMRDAGNRMGLYSSVRDVYRAMFDANAAAGGGDG